ncbi:MAG TPA: tRNA (guanosine(37)-N1)-methyltransferase TrmD [Soehngenia sp.]|nr:tRNA (guanosine(37)-N1)-methyltransferase TrmD [Soehngenia sp.]HPP30846.1 tRNA (guanosine(37)-N1)-methyltransferase TrmD [Soehngenia sp.]
MIIDILTLFPEVFSYLYNYSIIGRALENNKFVLNTVNIRDFSKDKHKRVDDYPYGGGPGMILKPEPVYDAIMSCKTEKSHIVYLSPKGKLLNQDIVKNLARKEHIILLSGHYEGIDNRIVENYVDEEISIGDYVLTGGEIPAMVMIDSIVRLLPGVLASNESFENESFYKGLLEYPQYTRPENFRGKRVPKVLLSGDHMKIKKWRIVNSLYITLLNRPDIICSNKLDDSTSTVIEDIIKNI